VSLQNGIRAYVNTPSQTPDRVGRLAGSCRRAPETSWTGPSSTALNCRPNWT